ARWGNGAQQAFYLPDFAGESPPVAALAIDEPVPLFDPQRLQTCAWQDDSGFVLQGVKTAVPLACKAKFLLVAAQVAQLGPRLFIVEMDRPGIRLTPDLGMGLRAAELARVQFDRVRLDDTALLGEDNDF